MEIRRLNIKGITQVIFPLEIWISPGIFPMGISNRDNKYNPPAIINKISPRTASTRAS